MTDSDRGSGAGQGVERIAIVLRILARRNREGSRLTDIANEAALTKSTVHRLLNALIDQKLVDVDQLSGLYYLSFDLVAMSAAAADRYGLVELARSSVDQVERSTGDTVFLSVRAGNDSICVDRVTGTFPIKVLTLSIGDRRPLGVGAGSLALLAACEDTAVEEALRANAGVILTFPCYTLDLVRDMVARTRQEGYSFNDGRIVAGMQAVGVVVRDENGYPRASLSIAATVERMAEPRRAELVEHLHAAAANISKRLVGMPSRRLAFR